MKEKMINIYKQIIRNKEVDTLHSICFMFCYEVICDRECEDCPFKSIDNLQKLVEELEEK